MFPKETRYTGEEEAAVREYESHGPADTERLGEALAKELRPGAVVAFFGDMGSGKTVFTRGLARGLQCTETVSSPTFALVHEYGGEPPLVHFDMYRINTWDELDSTGFYDYIDNGCVLAVEWSENIENALPEDAVRVEFFRGSGENERLIRVTGETIHEDFGD
ncbi:MAG: tRNA (adenosine(37)-N6)-threonylcarbamoyltransferase complex ATPase subunit type 1 TsaE [Clostridia bacterium]|nr:tRNA (adenosine(37)-N6)-threonylcarbamoyltransferase complex ATPase subunit type 1 TsaE [Clostridia bacterium]